MPDCDEESRIVQQVMGQFDAPAFVRRARGVEEALQRLHERCRRQRTEWLEIPRLRLAIFHALIADWSRAGDYLADSSDVMSLQSLFNDWQPRLRASVAPTDSSRKIRLAAWQMRSAFERFNHRWTEFILELDLSAMNELRTDYNQFYVLEKECFVRSAVVARAGFQPLPPLSPEELFIVFPLLPVLQLAE